CGQGAHLPWTF
nr:immunoglobulin light chain junction region [Macaca mulatta]